MANKLDKIYSKAKVTITENDRVKAVLQEARAKIEKIGESTEEKSIFIRQLQLLIRMVKAHFSGEYHAFSMPTILSVIFALVYFITPIDLIPDFIPALGLSDDISIVYFIFKSISDDIERFEEWESSLNAQAD